MCEKRAATGESIQIYPLGRRNFGTRQFTQDCDIGIFFASQKVTGSPTPNTSIPVRYVKHNLIDVSVQAPESAKKSNAVGTTSVRLALDQNFAQNRILNILTPRLHRCSHKIIKRKITNNLKRDGIAGIYVGFQFGQWRCYVMDNWLTLFYKWLYT